MPRFSSCVVAALAVVGVLANGAAAAAAAKPAEPACIKFSMEGIEVIKPMCKDPVMACGDADTGCLCVPASPGHVASSRPLAPSPHSAQTFY